MRKSRQPRCTAAKSIGVAAQTSKLLDAERNFDRAILGASSAGWRCRSSKRPGWHQVKQRVPDA
jgi:hypothetical protein